MTNLTKRFLTNYAAVAGVYTIIVLVFKSDLKTYIIGILAITAGSVTGTALRIWRSKQAMKDDNRKN